MKDFKFTILLLVEVVISICALINFNHLKTFIPAEMTALWLCAIVITIIMFFKEHSTGRDDEEEAAISDLSKIRPALYERPQYDESISVGENVYCTWNRSPKVRSDFHRITVIDINRDIEACTIRHQDSGAYRTISVYQLTREIPNLISHLGQKSE